MSEGSPCRLTTAGGDLRHSAAPEELGHRFLAGRVQLGVGFPDVVEDGLPAACCALAADVLEPGEKGFGHLGLCHRGSPVGSNPDTKKPVSRWVGVGAVPTPPRS